MRNRDMTSEHEAFMEAIRRETKKKKIQEYITPAFNFAVMGSMIGTSILAYNQMPEIPNTFFKSVGAAGTGWSTMMAGVLTLSAFGLLHKGIKPAIKNNKARRIFTLTTLTMSLTLGGMASYHSYDNIRDFMINNLDDKANVEQTYEEPQKRKSHKELRNRP